MTKFGKELEAQVVPEWQEKYCDYVALNNDLKRIKQHRIMGPTYTRTGTSLGILRSIASTKAANFTRTFTRQFSTRGSPSPRARPDYMASMSIKGMHSKDVVTVTKRKTDDSEMFITELHEPLNHSPQDLTYFARLDAQATKVNKFYKMKEADNIAHAAVLEKKMYELINAQEVLARDGIDFTPPSHQQHHHHDALHMTSPSRDRTQNPRELSDELPLISEDSARSESFLMEPADVRRADSGDDDTIDDSISRYIIDHTASKNLKSEARRESAAAGSILKLRSAMKSTPGSSASVVPEPIAEDRELQNILRGNSDVESQQRTYTEKEIAEARKLLQRAWVDFYRSLTMLSSYRSVNIAAFAKITKKYDAITGCQISPIYMKEVENSHFVISKKVHKLATKVEDIFVKHFAGGDRKQAMKQLRPVRKQGTHRTTFLLGLFSGSSIALTISFFFLVSNPLALDKGGGMGYLNTVFPIFSTLMLIAIHLYFYGWNVYAWQKTRINYPFIFQFSPSTELRFREVLLIATGFTTFLLGCMNIHIAMTLLTHVDPPMVAINRVPAPAPSALQQDYSTAVDIIPLLMVLITVVVLFFPFNIFYRSSRAFFLGCFRRLVIAPLVAVRLSDFFLGDQFTSQVLVFRNLEYVACYYSGGYFLTNQQDHVCKKNAVYQGFGYVVALLPYWWRFLQCLRRWNEEGDEHQRDNAAKYFSAIVAVGLRQAYTNYRGRPAEIPLLILMIIASIIATVFTTYWDLFVDWGLLKKQSRNKWLRDKLALKNKSLYFIAMGANCVLRLAWLATLIQAPVSLGLNQNAFDVCMAVLEISRRGMWNYFRIENEHLTNVGKYRAEKAVPLPFSDDM